MPRPLVSIITPVLNRVETLPHCLAAVANQDYQGPIEHLVIDGGSTDGTVDLLRQSRTPRLRWQSEPDGGMYEAINKGLEMAEGHVLAYLNSDDLYLPWSVRVAVDGLASGSEMVYGDMGVLCEQEFAGFDGFYVMFYPRFDLRYYSYIGVIGQPTVFWRRELTERLGFFDTTYRNIGDCEYWLRAARSGISPKHIPEVLAIQVDHMETLTKRFPERLQREHGRLRREMAPFVSPPRRSPKAAMRMKSLVWRLRNLQFFVETRSGRPRRWPHLVGCLQAQGIDVTAGNLLRVLAPGRWRRHASLIGHDGNLRALVEACTTPSSSPA